MEHMPRNVAKRIVSLCAKDEVVVVVPRRKKPSRVFRYDKYQIMKEVPLKVRPWEARAAARKARDPLGAVKGTVRGPLRRDSIYE